MPTQAPANTVFLKPSQITKALAAMIAVKQPVIIWGEPGIGKSMIVQQTADRLGLTCQDVRAVLLDPVDLRGLPHVNGDGRSHWAIPEFLPRDGNGVLFLDELNRAPTLVQNGCLSLILDRKLGEYTLPDGWSVVAACNNESDGGGITRMISALSNRFAHISATTDVADWCKWALGANVDPMVIAFIRFRPNLLHVFDTKARAFPSPRSWSFVSKILGQMLEPDIQFALIEGTVGHGAAVEFTAFERIYRNLPSIDAILLNPTGAAVPTDVATLYAVSSALAHRADDANFGRIVQYLERLPGEYETFAVKDATTRNPALASTPTFVAWGIKHEGQL
jgi:hypothetical protein